MHIEVADALFQDPSNDLELIALFWLAFDREHTVQTSSLWQQGNGGHVGAWVSRMSPELGVFVKDLLGNHIGAAIRHQGATTVVVESAPRGSTSGGLSLADALRFVAQPLTVLVENWRTDREFILRVACSRNARRALEKAIECGNLRFANGGGIGDMKVYVNEVNSFEAQRLVAISDSDDRGSGPSQQVGELAKSCHAREPDGLRYHRLRRRAIENYLPNSVLHQWKVRRVDKREVVDAFCNELTDEQRRCFNMKRGFGKHESPKDSPAFENLNEGVVSRLGNGFGKALMSQVLFEFGLEIERTDLSTSGTLGELEDLVDLISSRL